MRGVGGVTSSLVRQLRERIRLRKVSAQGKGLWRQFGRAAIGVRGEQGMDKRTWMWSLHRLQVLGYRLQVCWVKGTDEWER